MRKSLKSAIVIPFIIIFVITFFGVSIVQFYNYEKRVGILGNDKMLSVSDSIKIKLDHFLNEPLHLAMVMAKIIESENVTKEKELSRIQIYLKNFISNVNVEVPQIDIVGYGSESSNYIGYQKNSDNKSQLILKDQRTNGKMTFFSDDSPKSNTVMVINDYDPRDRPWYSFAVDMKRPVWSDIYTSIYNSTPTISASVPIVDNLKNTSGVLAFDININTLTEFVLDLKSKHNVMVYILCRDGKIIAHSEESDSSGLSKLRKALPPVMAKSLRHLSSQVILGELEDTISYKTDVESEVYYNSVTPYIPYGDSGLRWYIGISVSKDSLYKGIFVNRGTSWIIGAFICLIGLFVFAIYIKKIISPIDLTITAAKQITSGEKVGTIANGSKIKEIEMLVTSFNRMSVKVDSTIVKLKDKAFTDELTGLLSKAGLVDSYKTLDNKQGTLFIFSISAFNNINDSLGYDKGDLVIKEVANRLNKFVEGYGLIARIDGGKFALFSSKDLDFRQSKFYATRIKQLLTDRLVIDDVDVAFRISVGIVTDVLKYSGMELCLRNASIALSEGEKGQGRIFHFSDEMLEKIEHKTRMCAEIKRGIEKHEFIPFYQPIVDLKSGKAVGAEALARWISPKLGMVPPDKFISVAEENGFIEQLGDSILFQACLDVTKGIAEGKWPADFKMHVNISVLQLSRSSFFTSLQDIINSTNVNPKNLSLEITESGLVENTGVFNRNLEAIIAMGIHISIDDFGTGYSSLSYLQKLEFDCLKIDRAFVSTLTEENYESSLTAMIVKISQTIDTYVVAEGIETETQANLLSKLNCQLGQGYYFGRPAPYDDWAAS
ncbi:EAL domain-containing protein [Vibrio sp. B1FLJ16]|uniref:bifunctional diguanylate cyclase/phosphodiesterase n=1 Tax=Vibrio sp. B1FLJ16 TaxID=2751178 RepID=UPI0015F6B3E1|nr:EAL domain-containing protein [Vibrio sp. B1FLJ16]CAD7818602.1 an EAL and a GGDEF domain [Vibrio sp. B1FLJ16]CAE6935360.1 an EAL and a GGDEF domain [Vibrio sp. B1FLJ16]